MQSALAVAFALATALANAFALASQHAASVSGDPSRRGWALLAYLVRHPLWLLGWIGMGASLLCQAIALHYGPLALVQPLLVTELVLALVIRKLWLHQELRRMAWASASVTTLALVVFLVTTNPRASTWQPTLRDWTGPGIVVAVLVAIASVVARRGSPARRAGAYAGATAALWALEATFIKATADVLVAGGISTMLTSWPLYALIGCGAVGLLTEQAALHVGPLKISQPIIVIVDPLASIVLGVSLYHERLVTSPLSSAFAGIAFVVVTVGVVVMTRTVPDTAHALHRR